MDIIDLKEDPRPLVLLSDIHGEFWRLTKKLENLNDLIIIQLGDFGIFGQFGEEKQLDNLNKVCQNNNITLIVYRGNHENDSFFKEINPLSSNITLIPDYTYLETQKGTILCVGGAISIDRGARTEFIDYWAGEKFILKPHLVKEVDILLTHSAPSWIGPGVDAPIIKHYERFDPKLVADLLKERADIDWLFELAKPKRAYAGHFHQKYTAENNGCRARILKIFEFLEIQ